jgi:hypothetical protein
MVCNIVLTRQLVNSLFVAARVAQGKDPQHDNKAHLMNKHFLSLRRSAWIALVVIASGCGPQAGIERVVVSGNVTFSGKPLEKGQIRFIPTGDTSGPITVEPIVDGYYTSEDVGGVPVGAHRVEILGYDAEVYANAPKGPGAPGIPQLLPKKYNHESELEAVLESGESEKTLDFDLKP